MRPQFPRLVVKYTATEEGGTHRLERGSRTSSERRYKQQAMGRERYGRYDCNAPRECRFYMRIDSMVVMRTALTIGCRRRR